MALPALREARMVMYSNPASQGLYDRLYSPRLALGDE